MDFPYFLLVVDNVPSYLPHMLAITALVIASFTDLKTREVPDWINFGLVGVGFAINALFSLFFWNYEFIVASIVGFGIFFGFGMLMFYTGQWGGGDSKMLMGLGALLGINVFGSGIPFLAEFVINMLLVGAAYGIFWSLFLIMLHPKRFYKVFANYLEKREMRIARWGLLILLLFTLIGILIWWDTSMAWIIAYLYLLLALTTYLWGAIKSVEEACMLKMVSPDKLTEGDWIAKNVIINGKVFTGPKDLGIEKHKIQKLVSLYRQGKIKKVLIKEGIPFVPSFLIAYGLTLMYGSVLMFFI